MPENDLTARLEELLAKQAIEELLIRVKRAGDRFDLALMESCFHPDAEIDTGMYQGGREEWLEGLKTQSPNKLGATHFLTQILTEVHGDTAESESYSLSFVRSKNESSSPTGLADRVYATRTLNTCKRQDDGSWQIVKHTIIWDWTRFDAVTEEAVAYEDGLPETVTRRRLFPDDLVYSAS